jgi:hypothetical protein
MKLLTTLSALLISLVPLAFAGADSNFEAAARAKAISPVIEEGTILVAHIDLSRIASRPMLDLLGHVRFIRPPDMWGEQENMLSQAGVRDLYLIAPSVIFALEQPRMLVAIPVSSPEQEKAVRTNLRLKDEDTRRVGDLLLIGNRLPPPKTFRPAARPELAAAFEAAGDTAVQVILIPPADTQRVVDELWPQLPSELGGGPSSVLTRGIRWAAAGIDVSPHKSLRLVVKSADAQAAEALRGKLVDLLRLAGRWSEIRQRVADFEVVTAFLTPQVDGDRLIVSSGEKTEGFEKSLAALMRPLSEVQSRLASKDSLRQIALGMHNYHWANKHFPLPASHGPGGKPLLSWRVHLLPFMDQYSLFKQFHLNEPWDSPHNRTLIDKMPAVYRLPMAKTETGRTNYLLPVGNGAAFDADKPTAFTDIRDGTITTIMAIEVDDAQAVIWTKPDDWPFDPKDPIRGLGGLYGNGFYVVTCDGSVHFINLPKDAKATANVRAMFTRAGRESVVW